MIPYSTQWIEEDDIAAVAEVMRGTHLTQGPSIERFEKALAEYLRVKHVVAVASGTAALHLAVLCIKEELRKKFGEKTQVRGFVPPITFAASLNCFWYTDSVATLVDVDAKTGQMTPETLEAALSQTPRVDNEKWIVVPVSLQGRPMDYVGLKAVADKYGAILLEDAAHGMSGYYFAPTPLSPPVERGDNSSGSLSPSPAGALPIDPVERIGAEDLPLQTHKMGSCAHTFAAITSFHSVKQLCLGEGGAVLTNDDTLAAKVRLLRSHGIVRVTDKDHPSWYYQQIDLGFHYRISDMHCALGLSQLKKLDARYARRQVLARCYDETFANEDIFKNNFWFVPCVKGHAYHLYKIHFKNDAIRNAAHEFLKTKGFFSQIHYTPLHHFPYQAKRLAECMAGDKGAVAPILLPGAEAHFAGALSIPLFAKMTNEQQAQVVDALREFCQTQLKTDLRLKTEVGEYRASVKPIQSQQTAR